MAAKSEVNKLVSIILSSSSEWSKRLKCLGHIAIIWFSVFSASLINAYADISAMSCSTL